MIDAEDGKAKVVDAGADLQSLYELIGCGCIGISPRFVGGKMYHIVYDDEFLLKEELPTLTATTDGVPEMFGNIAVFGCDGEWGDELGDLTDSDIANLLGHTARMSPYWDGRVIPVLGMTYWDGR